MSDMIERVARAICEAGNDGFVCCCPHRVDGWCLGGRIREQARAAIEAMREPTSAVAEAGGNAHCGNDWMSPEDFPVEAAVVWRAMIDAALAETP